MSFYRNQPPYGSRRRTGYTFMELVVSMASATMILGGLSASLYIASRGLEPGGTARRAEADQLLDGLVADVEHALAFSERTANAATFTVPDRDGDGRPDTIRYAWSGTPGDPLTYAYNGSAPESIADDVQNFNLAALTRYMAAPVIPPSVGGSHLLLVVSEAGNLSSKELDRKTLIESWRYTVTVIDDSDSQANFNDAIAENDVVYIPESITSSELGTKLTAAAIGVVNEEGEQVDELGFANDKVFKSRSQIDVVENSHYITSTFSTGLVTFVSSDQSVHFLSGGEAAGLVTLGKTFNTGSLWGPSLAVIPSGGSLAGGGYAAGRRVELPWGDGTFDINLLTADGRTIMQRAIEWAAGAGDAPLPKLLLVVADPAAPTADEDARKSLIESWGYLVTLIDDDDTQANCDAATAIHDVAYVPLTANDGSLGIKLRDAPIGVVSELHKLVQEFGFAGDSLGVAGTGIEIADPSHFITSGFSVGTLPIFSSTYDVVEILPPLAPNLQPLAKQSQSRPVLSVLNQGAEISGGGNAAARRVMLPWGTGNFDFAALNADGQTIMKRSIEWAAGAGDDGAGSGGGPDGNFGYETQFASGLSSGNGVQVGTQVTLTEDGTLSSITAYIDPRNKDFRYAIYTDNGGEPGNLIVESAVDRQSGKDWKTISVTPTPLTAGTYWLALSFSHGTQKYYYESTGGTTRHKLHPAVQNGFISVWPGSTTPYPYKVSIYGTYSPSN